jgi:integrase
MRQRKRDYLFLRPNSRYWRVRFQLGGRSVEKSLGTTDRQQAEIMALPLIAQHKAKLLEARPRFETSWRPEYEPGREHIKPNGERVIATERELLHLDAEGRIIDKTENGGLFHQLVTDKKLTLRSLMEAYGIGRPAAPTKNGDDAILETYLKHANITGHFEREARNVWALFKTLTNGKPLKECTRDDGRRLVEHFRNEDLKSATINKKIAWLNAAVNFAMKEGTARFNPFASIVPKVDDGERRVPLDETDMRACKRNLGTLIETDQLLFRLLASTGMRLGEAFQISSESTERGVRYVIIGTKTEASKRRVPLPAGVLPHLPKTIKGPLFQGGAPRASKRLNRFLRDSGVTAPGKVIHSLRHRAADRLRAAGAPTDIRHALLGHEKRTIADSYGAGHPVLLLRKWIDKIGF